MADIPDTEKTEIIEEIKLLSNDLGTATKKAATSRLSKIAQKIFTLDSKVYHFIFDVLLKSFIKDVFTATADHALPAVQKALEWFASHPTPPI